MKMFDVLKYLAISLVIFLVIRYNWRRRYLYFYGAKIPGVFALPIIGSTYVFFKERKESLGDVNPKNFEAILNKIMTLGLKSEELMMKRIQEPWLLIDFLWKLSSYGTDAQFVKKEADKLVNLILDSKNAEMDKIRNNATRQKHLLNNMIDFENMSREEVIQEMIFFVIAGSETVASTIANVLLMLGMFEDVQEKVYQEQNSIFGIDNRKPSLGDLNRMEYLQRVINETLRVFPAVPLIARAVTEDVFLDPYVLPSGSMVAIPILHIHRSPELWSDPLTFNPDRFLREEALKRHHCSYIPFSFGSRNCIGFYYALMEIRVSVSKIVRAYKIKTLEYQNFEDIELHYGILTRPKKLRLIFEKRS